MARFPLPPGSTIGVLGGGQLGRMFAHAAQRSGYRVAVLDPDEASPAGTIAHEQVRTAYLDPAGLARLAEVSAALTTEFENVPAEALATLARSRLVAPSAEAVAMLAHGDAVLQNKLDAFRARQSDAARAMSAELK